MRAVVRLAGLRPRGRPRRRRRRGGGGRPCRPRATAAAARSTSPRRAPAVRRRPRLLAGPRRAAGPRRDHGAHLPRRRPRSSCTTSAPASDYLEANPGVVAEACFRCIARRGDRRRAQHGVARAAARRRPRLSARVRPRLGARIDALGGLPSESATQRMLRHVADMAALQDADAVADALLNAALDIVPLGSALLAAPTGAGGDCGPSVAAGPLARVLRAARLEPIGAWVEDGMSCFTVGEPERRPRPTWPSCAPPGWRRWSPSGSSHRASSWAPSCWPPTSRVTIGTDDVELLEQLATPAPRACAPPSSWARCASAPRPTRSRASATTRPSTRPSPARTGGRRTAVVVCDIDGFKAPQRHLRPRPRRSRPVRRSPTP